MTPDEICREFAGAHGIPERALIAAVAQAADLAPRVIALLRNATEGVCLLPDEEDIVYFGLHALAAARHSDACPAFVAWLRQRSETDGEALLREVYDDVERQVLLGVFDGNADALYDALEDPATDGSARWNLFCVLARLAWDGRIERERLIALIDRFDRKRMAPPGDWAWQGWQDAIMYLGLENMRDRVRRAWNGPLSDMSEADQEEWLEALDFTVAHPRDPKYFINDSVVPMPDPMEVLSRFGRGEPLDARGQETAADRTGVPSLREMSWLNGLLCSKHVSIHAMDMEMLDGFLTALAVGPGSVPQPEFMRPIWDTEDGESPSWHSPEQERFATGLVGRYLGSIVQRLSSEQFPELSIDPYEKDWPGRRWAMGFMHAMQLRPSAWTPLIEDPNVGSIMAVILGLAGDEADGNEVLRGRLRDDALTALPFGLAITREFWSDPKGVSARLAASTHKVGRNAPCPCGSGKKYKRCCGARKPLH